jgi:hypothetical protein
MDMPIDLRPSEVDRPHPTDSSHIYYGGASGDYIFANGTGNTVFEPDITTGEASGTHSVNQTAYNSINLLLLDGADIVLNGDVRLYLQAQSYYYNDSTLGNYPDGSTKRTRMYFHMGSLVLVNDTPYSYRYLSDGTLVKAPSGIEEYTDNPGLYRDAEEYGKVYFNADVYLHVTANTDNHGSGSVLTLRQLETYIPKPASGSNTGTSTRSVTSAGSSINSRLIYQAGDVYLFRKNHTGTKGEYTGVDLFGWYISTQNTDEIKAIRKVLTGAETGVFTFNEHTVEDFIRLTDPADIEQPAMTGLTQIVWE